MLKTSAVSGLKWSTASQVSRQLMLLLTTIILARLLAPSDFGLIGMATVITGFVGLFHDLGTSAAVIQRKELNESLLSSVFWINVGFGTLAMVILYLLSPLFAYLYREPRVVPLLQLLSVTFFISGLSMLQNALLQRSMAFNKLAKLEIAATAVSSAVGIGAAFLGFGAWSLVYQALALTVVTTALLWAASSWRPRISFQLQEALSIGRYSLNLSGYNIFNYFVRNADYFLIGRYLGAQDLGFYTLAYRIMLYPLQNVSAVIGRVMFPLFSKIQDDLPRFRNAYLLVTGAIALVTFPMMFGLWALAEPFVLTIFGNQWLPVAALLVILIPVGMFQSIGTTVGPIYQAKGRTDVMFRWGVGSGTLAVIGFVIGLQWGTVGVAMAYAVVSMILVYPCFAIPFRFIELSMADLARSLWRPFACSALMLGVLLLGKLALPIDLSDAALLSGLIPLGIVVYGFATRLINWEKAQGVYLAIRRKA
jgi:PST family polysaccharide transporter